MRFYEKHGLDEITRCGDARPNGRGIPGGVRSALQQISRGTPESIRSGADQIAQYEQFEIVQARIYDDPEVVETFERNQWWAKRPLGRMMGAQKPEIVLSAECDGDKVPFRGDISAADDRVAYYGTLMDAFESRGVAWQGQTMTRIARLIH